MTPLSPESLMSTVRELPALPAVVVELIELLGRDGVSADQLVAKISHDQALTAKALRLANSSFYGMSRKVSRVSDAISVLGLRTVRTVVTTAAVTGSFCPPCCDGFDFVAFWRHAIGTAVCARLLAATMKIDPEAAFTAGLLHDLGHLVLASCFPDRFSEVLRLQAERDIPAIDAEHTLLGMDHAAVGGLMAEHWRFAPAVVQAIRQHHTPDVEGEGARLCSLVHVADNIVHALDLAHVDGDAVPALSATAWMRVGLDAARCRQVFEQTETQTESVCEVLI
jgi:putative nucleotidyltransferase with HDIG domain